MSLLRPNARAFAAAQRSWDAVAIGVVLYGTTAYLGQQWADRHFAAVLVAAAGFILVGETRRLYSSWRLQSLDEEFRTVLIAWVITAAALIVVAFLSKVSDQYSRLSTIAWILFTPSALIGSRLLLRVLLRAARRAGKNTRSVAVVGASTFGNQVLKALGETKDFGLSVIGLFDDRSHGRLTQEGVDASMVRGNWRALVERARAGEIDYIFIALPMRAERRIVSLVNQLADTTASVYVVPDFFVFDLMRARMTMLGGMPAVSVYESPFDGLSGFVKRVEDLLLGSVLLLLSALPMLSIAIALKATKAQTIFFRQQRYGLNGKVVKVWKFRTMTVSEDGADVVQAKRQDPRITPLGAFLRATSLDELPQLFNVLTGEMSLVGPRPHAVRVNEEFRRLVHGYMLRHKVKPGITGWAQVNGWHGDDTVEKMQKRVEHDLAYLQDWSLWLDLKILYLTVVAVFGRGKRRGEVAP